MIEFTFCCPACGGHLKCETDSIGTSVSCPHCSENVTVPSQPEIASAEKSESTDSDTENDTSSIRIPKRKWLRQLLFLFIGMLVFADLLFFHKLALDTLDYSRQGWLCASATQRKINVLECRNRDLARIVDAASGIESNLKHLSGEVSSLSKQLGSLSSRSSSENSVSEMLESISRRVAGIDSRVSDVSDIYEQLCKQNPYGRHGKDRILDRIIRIEEAVSNIEWSVR